MKVSIILPSYNRYPLILYTLYALEKQSFVSSEMEVIVIDDASTDKTPLLKDYKAPYCYKYVRNKQNEGRATTRNIGGKIATGEVVIFLDAEMLVHPDFVKYHYENHKNKDHIVVVGGTERLKIFSYLFQGYNRKQIKRIEKLVTNNPIVKERIAKGIGEKVYDQELPNLINKIKNPIPIIFREDILNPTMLESFIIKTKTYDRLLTYLGDDFGHSPITWMTCGGILSLKKELFDAIGGYEEKFMGWGPEDVEFAYRLKKFGAKFVIDNRIRLSHQEHPIQINRNNEDKKNWVIFQEKHPDLEICVRAINLISEQDYYAFIDHVVREQLALNKEFPQKYKRFEESLIAMLKQIRILDLRKKPIKQLLKSSGISSKTKSVIFKERDEIASHHKFPTLIKLFDLLVHT